MNRYGKAMWKINHIIHSIVGVIMTGCVGFAAIYIINYSGGIKFKSAHNISGFISFILTLCLGVGGISANIMRFAIKPRWKTNLILLGGKVHKYFGYFMVLGT
jgi:hypothetical protein